MNCFYYYQSLENIGLKDNVRILCIPLKVSDEESMCNVYEKGLDMPSYFGRNWSALDDCLSDMSFVEEKNIIIIHEDIPFANNEKEKILYLETLKDTISLWWEYPEHKFYVYFPENYRSEVSRLMHLISTKE